MVNWPAILELWIYPIAALFPLLDAISTTVLLKYDEAAKEVNSLPRTFHEKLGIAKGQVVFSTMVLPLWLGVIYIGVNYSDLTITLLMVGLADGFVLKQTLTAWFAFKQNSERY